MLFKIMESQTPGDATACFCGRPRSEWTNRYPHPSTCPEHPARLDFIRYYVGTQEEADALIAPTPRMRARACSYDETRLYFLGLRRDALLHHIGRVESILSSNPGLLKRVKASYEQALKESEELSDQEEAAIVALLSR